MEERLDVLAELYALSRSQLLRRFVTEKLEEEERQLAEPERLLEVSA